MKMPVKLLVYVFVGILYWPQVIAFAKPSDDETQLRQVLKTFNQAFMQADVTTLDSLLTDDYLHTNAGNKAFAKSNWLKWIKGRQASIKAGKLNYAV